MSPRLIWWLVSSLPELVRLGREIYRLMDEDPELARCELTKLKEECRFRAEEGDG